MLPSGGASTAQKCQLGSKAVTWGAGVGRASLGLLSIYSGAASPLPCAPLPEWSWGKCAGPSHQAQILLHSLLVWPGASHCPSLLPGEVGAVWAGLSTPGAGKARLTVMGSFPPRWPGWCKGCTEGPETGVHGHRLRGCRWIRGLKDQRVFLCNCQILWTLH